MSWLRYHQKALVEFIGEYHQSPNGLSDDSFKLVIELIQTLVRSSLVALEKSSVPQHSLQKKIGHDLSFASH